MKKEMPRLGDQRPHFNFYRADAACRLLVVTVQVCFEDAVLEVALINWLPRLAYQGPNRVGSGKLA